MSHAWTPAELLALEALAGNVPWPDAVAQYQQLAAERGWPLRNEHSLQVKCSAMGISCRARYGDWMTIYGLAELLGIGRNRVTRWVATARYRPTLAPVQRAGINYIRRDSLRRFARRHPAEWAGIPAERMALALEDAELAAQIAAMRLHRPGDYRVRCIDTGEVFCSQRAAAERYHVDRSSITYALARNGLVPSLGLRFERIVE